MVGLASDDPAVAGLVHNEALRIENTLDLIAAESLPRRSLLEAQGSVLALKAAEGYPGRRFHAGCGHVDDLERLGTARCRTLFDADHANIQPHSGVSANLAVYFSVLDPGDRVLSMRLSHGGHLSHGDAASITSKCFTFAHYSVSPRTELIDYEQLRELAREFRPRMIVAGASSYPRLIDYAQMASIAEESSAYLMADMAHIAGLVAAGVIPSPVPHCDFVTFTTYKTLMGSRGGVILCRKRFADRLDRTVFPGSQGTPSMNQLAAKAVCFKLAAEDAFVDCQKRILSNAACCAKAFAERGYRVVTGGTDTHLVLIDLRSKRLSGDVAETLLESVGIVVNRNVIPYDTASVSAPSGLRVGATSISARGMGTAEVVQIVDLIDAVLSAPGDTAVRLSAADAVAGLCRRFPAGMI